VIGTLASAGMIASTVIVGGATWWLLQAIGLELPFLFCLLFGAPCSCVYSTVSIGWTTDGPDCLVRAVYQRRCSDRAYAVARTFAPNAIKILTWGGLRGGISVALALSLPPGPEGDVIVAVT
jgi:NhaP-type Na+/H+ or K+/H+ antiporter